MYDGDVCVCLAPRCRSVTAPWPVWQVASVASQLEEYSARYAARLSSQNTLWIASLRSVLVALAAFLGQHTLSDGGTVPAPAGAPAAPSPAPAGAVDGAVLTIPEFVVAAKLSAVDFVGLARYMDTSPLSKKLRGLARSASGAGGDAPPGTAGYHAVRAFVSSLLTTAEDGRVLVRPEAVEGGVRRPATLKFCLLNAGSRLGPLISAARSVVLVGGTLHPIPNVVSQLFSDAPPERVSTLACGHVVPPDRVHAVVLTRGPTSPAPFNFSFASRGNDAQLAELGHAVVNLVTVVPAAAGTVCFLPSYDLEAKLWAAWTAHGVLDRLSKKCRVGLPPPPLSRHPRAHALVVASLTRVHTHTRTLILSELLWQVFREPRASADMGDVLTQYADCIAKVCRDLFNPHPPTLALVEGLAVNRRRAPRRCF